MHIFVIQDNCAAESYADNYDIADMATRASNVLLMSKGASNASSGAKSSKTAENPRRPAAPATGWPQPPPLPLQSQLRNLGRLPAKEVFGCSLMLKESTCQPVLGCCLA